ncbi:MAG: UDP-N-acetylmuramoyl-L-alanyl-D-glutamate--2,6-diaminopimelate ligase [Oscillospiraceae bacterium]
MKQYSLNHYIDLLEEKKLLTFQNAQAVQSSVIDLITYDSTAVKKNSLFVCKGAAFKEAYLLSAVSNGATAYVSEKKYDNCTAPCIIVSDVRKAMAYLAKSIYDNAYEKINLIGLTGTKGKSTTSYYIKYILDEYLVDNGLKKCGILSTNDIYDGVLTEEAHLTTPEALELHKHFDNAYQSGLKFMEMEVSSQALKYDRVLGVKYDVCAFLNISPDHISKNEHEDFNDYFSSKLKIFAQSKIACVNLDSDEIDTILKAATASQSILTFGTTANADIFGYDIKKVNDEIHFNVENALCAIAICYCYNIDYKYLFNGLKKARSTGRMEVHSSSDKKITVIVDYAHNKLSFDKLFSSVKKEYAGKEIIAVFGCPGNKAVNRRKELGEISAAYSDKIYLTEEDPAFESVSDICSEIKNYVVPFGCECHIINDRKQAIKSAILNSNGETVILITGKGNEKYQKANGTLIPYESDTFYTEMFLKEYDKLNMQNN